MPTQRRSVQRAYGRLEEKPAQAVHSPELRPAELTLGAFSRAPGLIVSGGERDRSRRNVLLLVLCQATFLSTTSLTATVASLAGYALAANKALATLPVTATVIGTAVGTIPASLLMRRVGRRLGFIGGTGLAVVGGLVGATAIWVASFWLLAAGSLLLGMSSAFAQLYRFAAAEAVSPGERSRAMSLVLAGGLAAAFVGPQLARATADLLAFRFGASYLAVPFLAALTAVFLFGLRLPAADAGATAGPTRPIAAIVGQPLFLAAVLMGMGGYGVMNLLMTGTPLAMTRDHGHGLGDAAFVIQWHVVGMFLPGFFTGGLIQRIGERSTILLGIASNAAGIAVAFAGADVRHFWLALTLVGVGWNLMFVGGSTLMTHTYASAERAKTQAAYDFLIWTTVAVTSLSSGHLLHHWGWRAVLSTAAPILGVAAAAILGAAWRGTLPARQEER